MSVYANKLATLDKVQPRHHLEQVRAIVSADICLLTGTKDIIH